VGATFSYELDLFGRLSGASNAAKLDAVGREGLLQSTRLAGSGRSGADLPATARASTPNAR
jgi:hypothetical protein